MSDLVVTFIADWCFTAQHTLLCPSFFWLTIGLFPVWKFYTIRMLWIYCTNLWGFKFSFFLGKCLGEEMLGHRVGPHLSWWETVFPKDYHFALTPAKFLRCFPSSTCYPLSVFHSPVISVGMSGTSSQWCSVFFHVLTGHSNHLFCVDMDKSFAYF